MAKPRKPGTARTTRAKAGAKLKSDTEDDAKIEDAEIVEDAPAAEANATADAPAFSEVPTARSENAGAAEALDAGAGGAEDNRPESDVEPLPYSADDGTTTSDDETDAARDEEAAEGLNAGAKSDEPTDLAAAEPADPSENEAGRDVFPMPPSTGEPPRRGGFMPLFLGGVLAAILGAGALYLGHTQGWINLGATNDAEFQARLEAQDAQAAELQQAVTDAQSEIAALREAAPDLGPLTESSTTLSEIVAGLDTRLSDLSDRLDATDIRVAEVETQPIPKAELPAEVVAAYEAKLGELQAALDVRSTALEAKQAERLAAIETRLEEQLAEIAAAQSAAFDAERLALETARNAEARAALAEIDSALDAGTGYSEALDQLSTASDTAVPDILARSAASGVPSLTELQASFPDAARAALRASTRAAADDGSVDRMTAFFRTQLGARSLEPRDGGDADAVLSRAENAVSRGDLSAALAEIEALPEAGRSALADWASRAETHIAARTAVAKLAQQLNSN